MSNATTAETRNAADITGGSWVIRFCGTHTPTGVIAERNWVKLDEKIGTHDIFEAGVSIIPGYTTLDSVEKILSVAGFSEVIPLFAFKMGDDGETTDTFTYPAARI